MKRVNEIASSDGSNEKVFPQVDIVFATFTDYVKETATQREKDLLIVSEFLTRVWQSLPEISEKHGPFRSVMDS